MSLLVYKYVHMLLAKGVHVIVNIVNNFVYTLRLISMKLQLYIFLHHPIDEADHLQYPF
ncbi:hypothetical protein ACTWP4_04505 [Gracilibacillus sp. D59]|uniref:hypothetical protein n=1 Tax=Gracilibacillus sp. D59 TaxID=3457434 RepID=UPI003FCCC0E0